MSGELRGPALECRVPPGAAIHVVVQIINERMFAERRRFIQRIANPDISFRPAVVEIGLLHPIERAVAAFIDMHDELEAMFGRSVDLLTVPSLRNPYLRKEILSTRRLAYAA